MTGTSTAGAHCAKCLFSTSIGNAVEQDISAEAPWTRLANYELFEEIGRGGMGVVYRAKQLGLDRSVAVKVLLRSQFAGAEERERFQREARATARLRHAGIVSVIDVGEDTGVPWFSMEYVPGLSLEQTLRDQPMEATAVANCVHSIAVALQHAHDQGVLHRDLKPSNILLDGAGLPRITDFGIALISSGDSAAAQLTRTGQMIGSPSYAAPEQALEGRADERTDVYGLGALLYYMLTGRPPFQGPTVDAVLMQLRGDDPVYPQRLNPKIPRDLQTICMKCLQKSPESRYPSAATTAQELSRFLDGVPILGRPASPAERTWRWMKKNPAMAGMISLICLLICGLIGGALAVVRHQTQLQHRSALIADARALGQTRQGGSRTLAWEKLLAAWAISPAEEIRTEAIARLTLPEITHAKRGHHSLPDTHLSADGLRRIIFRDGNLIVENKADHSVVSTIPQVRPDSLAKLDDTGENLALAAAGSNSLQLIRLRDQRVTAHCDHPLALSCVDWSGDLLATGCENRFIYLWDSKGQLKRRISGHEGNAVRLAFRPRSQELASTAEDHSIRLWHVGRGVEILHDEILHEPYTQLAWTPDGLSLIGQLPSGQADIFSYQPSPFFDLLSPPQEEPHTENLGSADFSPDGRLAAVVDEESLRIWDFASGRLIHQRQKIVGQWVSALFSPDGSKLWTCGWEDPLCESSISALQAKPRVLLKDKGFLLRDCTADGETLLLGGPGINVVRANGARVTHVRHPPVMACAIDPQGHWFISSSNQVPGAKVWSLPSGESQRVLCDKEQVYKALPFGPDSVLLKTSAGARIFNSTNWRETARLPAHIPVHSLAMSSDGGTLATMDNQQILLFQLPSMVEECRLSFPPQVRWPGPCHLIFDADASHLLAHTAQGDACRWNLPAVRAALAPLR
jgi:eukaryotic-like serine/threonine-protein kinase